MPLHSRVGEYLRMLSYFLNMQNKKSMCIEVHIRKQYTQPDQRYIAFALI